MKTDAIREYWHEAASIALEEAGISATSEQLKTIAESIENSADMRAEAFGEISIPDPRSIEIAELKKSLKKKDEECERAEMVWKKEACKVAMVDPDLVWRDGDDIMVYTGNRL